MAIVSFEGNFKQFNTAWGRILGFSHDEIRNSSLFELAHADDRAQLFATLAQLEHSGEQRFIERRFQCRAGSYRWLSCSLADYPDDRLCYIVARDVTDRIMERWPRLLGQFGGVNKVESHHGYAASFREGPA